MGQPHAASADLPRLGFIGLGAMGLGMTCNLARSGAALTVHDLDPAPVRRVADLGAHAAGSAAEVAAASDIVFLCLPDAAQVREVLAGDGGLLAGAGDGLLVVDHSTMNRNAARALAAVAGERGVAFCDCPVSGGPARAADGTLTIMFGGPAAHFERAREALEVTGRFVVHCGELGAGQLMKAVNNCIYDINIAAICEVMPLAVKAGLDPEVLARVVTSGSARSNAAERFVPRIMRGEFHTDFALQSAYKDIVNLQEVATELHAMTPLFNAMVAVYQQAMAAGHAGEPKSAMVKIYEQALGVQVRGAPPDATGGGKR